MSEPSLRSLAAQGVRRRLQAWAAPVQKDSADAGGIWGGAFSNFMGMDSGGGGKVKDQPADYERVRTAESYVYRCEEVRAKAISQVDLRIYQLDDNGNRKKAVDHDALAVLAMTNPYGWVSGIRRLMRYTLMSLDMHGRNAWEMAFSRRNAPTEIYWQMPAAWAPVPDESKPMRVLRGIRVHGTGIREIPAEKLVYMTTDNPADPLMGTSKIGVLKSAINLRASSVDSNQKFFDNSMRPDWVLSGSFANTDDNVQRLRRNIRRWLSGANNRAPLVLGEGMTAHLLTTSHEDAQWIEQQRLSQEEISAAFGVPVIFLNNYDRATYDNIKTAKLLLWHDTMIPEGDILAEDLTRAYLWRFWPESQRQKLAFAFDYAKIEGLGEDLALIWERMTKLMHEIDAQVQRRQLTPNQARTVYVQMVGELGLDVTPWAGDVPGGDMFYDNWNFTPLPEHTTQSVIDIMAARGANPQLEEDVPGAPTVGEHADAPDPDKAKALLSPPRLALPGDVLDLDAFRKDVAQAAGEAAIAAIGEALKTQQQASPPLRPIVIQKGPHPIPIRDNRIGPIQERLAKRLKRHFQDLQTQSLRSLRGAKAAERKDDPPVGPPPSGELIALLQGNSLYDQAAAKAAIVALIEQAAGDSSAAAYAASAEDYDLDVAWNEGNPWLEQYMGMRLPLIQGIDDNLTQRLRESLLEGAQAGETIPQLTNRVLAEFANAKDYRAEMIARTETVQAYGAASIQSYRDAGLLQCEMYDGLNDDGADCLGVNGLVVSLDDASRLMAEEHPMGTRGVAPVLPSDGSGASAAGTSGMTADEGGAEADLILESATAGLEIYVKAS